MGLVSAHGGRQQLCVLRKSLARRVFRNARKMGLERRIRGPVRAWAARESYRHGTATGSARFGRQLSQRQQRESEYRHAVSETALHPLRRHGRREGADAQDWTI